MKKIKNLKKLSLRKELIVDFRTAAELKGGAAARGGGGAAVQDECSSDCFTCECTPFDTMSGCNSAGCDGGTC